MKFSPDIFRARRQGFTLPEILIAMTIFTILIGAVVALQLFAVRIFQLAATKLTATADGRKSVNFIREQVREAKLIYIGTYSGTNTGTGTFSVASNTNQIGSALFVSPTNTAGFGTIFYQDPTVSNLCSVLITNATTSPDGSTITGTINAFTTDALFVTNNANVFQAEDFQGNILTDNSNNRIIHVTLQFSKLEYPVSGIGAGAMYDYYELHTRATRRSID
jgi:prepilin-type N-terminal cleavage/methylation domain-containing protein